MYIEVDLVTDRECAEILMAELAEIGFDTFEENEKGLKGYIPHQEFDKELLADIIHKYDKLFPIQYSILEIEKKNWNLEWEKNFHPIEINHLCRIRASFHEPIPEFKYEIEINPKMTFGTGHHSTTALMAQYQLEQNTPGMSVADIGCGTGILAILAAKMGAEKVIGLEIEDWSVENARENAAINNCKNVQIFLGKLSENPINEFFDIILANINKNVLLDEIPDYVKILKSGGTLILSGFYEEDISDLENKATQSGLKKISHKEKDRWAAVLFKNQ